MKNKTDIREAITALKGRADFFVSPCTQILAIQNPDPDDKP